VDNGLIYLPARADSPNVSVVRREAPLTLVAGVGSVPSNRAASPISAVASARIRAKATRRFRHYTKNPSVQRCRKSPRSVDFQDLNFLYGKQLIVV
jgi:hypothetical protein